MLLLHFSDIHFNSRDVNRPTDRNLGLRGDTVDDIRKMRAEIGKDVDVILISGDIAYKGNQEEYDYATVWLRDEVCPAAGCDFENIVVIPGNHDVDRKAADAPIHVMARNTLRAIPKSQADAEITKFVNSKQSSDTLFKPIENYNRFAAKFLCEIGYPDEQTGQKPYVERDFTLNDGSTLKVWGFNSVLVCDENDDVNRMFVDPSAAQVIRRDDGVTHLVMCHHPFNWLRNGAEFRTRIDASAKIHLFGHEHSLRVEDGRRYTRVAAGALHPDREEPNWQPGYNYIELSVSETDGDRVLDVKLWVRHLAGTQYIPLPDEEGHNPWVLGHKLGNWKATEAAPTSAGKVGTPLHTIEEETMSQSPPTVRSVAVKILALRESDQRKIITDLSLDQDGDQGLPDYVFAIAAVRRADARGDLAKLNEVLDKYAGAKN